VTARHGVRLRTLLRRPGRHGEAIPPEPTTLLQAPAPAETVAFGEWDTAAAREEAAAIFGPGAHGIATDETLAQIRAEAARQAAINAEVRRQVALDEQDKTRLDVRWNRPYTDPSMTRAEVLRAPWFPPLTGEECARRMAQVKCPPGGAGRKQMAAYMAQVAAATGTLTGFEQASAWQGRRQPRPGVQDDARNEPLRPWDLRPPLLALPAAVNGVAA
jgi:hypothetical protein